MKLFILTSIFISSACVSSVFADEAATTSSFHQHQRGQQTNNKRWFKYGVCVGQNLAQQGVVISAGQQLDPSYAEHIKTAKEACRELVRPSASPSPTPSVSPSPSPSPSASPVSDGVSSSSSN